MKIQIPIKIRFYYYKLFPVIYILLPSKHYDYYINSKAFSRYSNILRGFQRNPAVL